MTTSSTSSKAGLKWLFKMAWRDGKASSSRLLLFMASIILGIAAVVAIQSFSENLQQNIESQSKALMGADFIIDSRQLPNEKVQHIIDSLGGADAYEVNFASMAAFPKNDGVKLMRVRGIEGDFPFYGTLDTEPVAAATSYQNEEGALVDATVMLQYELNPGDSVKVGNVTLPIVGALKSAPGSTAAGSTIAPPIVIPFKFIEATELLQVGSRKEYQYFFVAPPDMDLEELDKNLDPILDAENVDLDTHLGASQQLGRGYENVSKFLNLVAFIALLLGCVGIASSVHIYIKEKLRAVAVLKCLGATRRQSFLIYLIQIAVMGLIGGVIGTLVGLGFQQVFPLILQEFLPFEVAIILNWPPIIMGLLLGVFMSVAFALMPLLSTWYVSPLEVLRVQKESAVKSKWARLLTLTGILLFVYLFAYWLLENVVYALGFVITTLITFSILAGVATLFMRAIKEFFPTSWGFTARQSLLNLFRPNNQTTVLIVAIGLGTFLISTLYFTKDILLARTSLENNSNSPNIILLDVQSDQREAVANSITPNGLPVIDNMSIVTMRIHSIKGKLSKEIRSDSTMRIQEWVLNHEFRATYRDSLIASEVISEGEWTPTLAPGEPVVISIADGIAEDANVGVGDEIVFNVQGVLMPTTVGSIREVDWGRAQMNFLVVFPNGVLENAPQFHVLTTRTPDEQTSATLQRELIKKFPNVSVIDLRQILSLIEDILTKISWVINFMAFFSILTGIIVLIGSVRTSKFQRIKESVLLRTLGAKSKQILRIMALEYFYLGIIGSGIGVLLSLVSSLLLALWVFEVPFVPSVIPFLVFLPGITALVMAIGLGNSRSVLVSPPLEVLRKEQ